MLRRILSALICLLFVGAITGTAQLHAGEASPLSTGQLIYVPAYSHIYVGNRAKPFPLTVTLSIRNVDPARVVTVEQADYYETQGKLLKKFVEDPVVMRPLESVRFIIPQNDGSGGSGANFIVRWSAPAPVNPPIVESIMIGTQTQQGVSFTSRGRVIVEPQ